MQVIVGLKSRMASHGLSRTWGRFSSGSGFAISGSEPDHKSEPNLDTTLHASFLQPVWPPMESVLTGGMLGEC